MTHLHLEQKRTCRLMSVGGSIWNIKDGVKIVQDLVYMYIYKF